jgi:orotidine-5'-phosphate decarboxylase
LAKQAGLDGVVCSVHEAAAVRKACGQDLIIVTPGIRLPGGGEGDQKRVDTPDEAVKAGSDFLVVGRPIVAAADPLAAVQAFLSSII